MISKIRAFASRINYRHPLTLAVAVSTTVCFILIASVAVWRAYANRSMRKHYPTKNLPGLGITASLRTERIDGSVEYIFQVRPISDASQDRFDEVVQKRGRNGLKFSIVLEDDGRFELCQTKVPWKPVQGDKGKMVELIGLGVFADCPTSHYSRASQWTVAYTYPLMTENLSPDVPQNNLPETAKMAVLTGQKEPCKNCKGTGHTLTVPNISKSASISGVNALNLPHDVLTGADAVSGDVETLSDHSFRVTRDAERMALIPWQPSDKLAITCNGASCLITDENNGRSVHARLVP